MQRIVNKYFDNRENQMMEVSELYFTMVKKKISKNPFINIKVTIRRSSKIDVDVTINEYILENI